VVVDEELVEGKVFEIFFFPGGSGQMSGALKLLRVGLMIVAGLFSAAFRLSIINLAFA
jgi:hypothetical protein